MSRRGEIQLTPDEQDAFLREPHKAALATVDKDGFPHVVAMGFLAKDDAIYMTSYAKAQKVLNVRRNPKVGVMITEGRAKTVDIEAFSIRRFAEGKTVEGPYPYATRPDHRDPAASQTA